VSGVNRVCVLRHRGTADNLVLPADLSSAVDVLAVAEDGPPPDLRAPVLFTGAWHGGARNLHDVVLACGVDWVHFYGTGLDGLDLPRLAEGGRRITNSAGAAAVPIAEWVLTAMLAFEKRLPETWLSAPSESWFRRTPLGTLYDRPLAVVGLGGVGRAVARRAQAFGMRVRGLRRRSTGSPGVHLATDLAEVLDGAAHVVLTAPLTARTRGLIGTAAFAAMAPGVHLVNVARGALVDHDALRCALDSGVVARATLDVADPEPPPPGHWLCGHPGVRLTPHLSYAWPRSRATHIDRFLDNLRRYLAGEPLHNTIDPVAGY
jgi:phosphoglycerate dehydrogenase-like enzyme